MCISCFYCFIVFVVVVLYTDRVWLQSCVSNAGHPGIATEYIQTTTAPIRIKEKETKNKSNQTIRHILLGLPAVEKKKCQDKILLSSEYSTCAIDGPYWPGEKWSLPVRYQGDAQVAAYLVQNYGGFASH